MLFLPFERVRAKPVCVFLHFEVCAEARRFRIEPGMASVAIRAKFVCCLLGFLDGLLITTAGFRFFMLFPPSTLVYSNV